MSQEDLLSKHPLLKFSFYTQLQTEAVMAEGQEIMSLLDSGFQDSGIDGKPYQTAYAKSWLWVLGAYEVVRTMSHYSRCFSPSVQDRIAVLKRKLAQIRMPFAKQELAGQAGAISNEASPVNFDVRGRTSLSESKTLKSP